MTKTTTKRMTDEALDELLVAAHAAGMAAGRGVTPPTMVVEARSDPFDRASELLERWVVPEGPCGFGWVTVRPANCRLAKRMALMFTGGMGGSARHDSYGGGMMLWVWEFGQSATRKDCYARAFAKVLTDAGFRADAGSRLD